MAMLFGIVYLKGIKKGQESYKSKKQQQQEQWKDTKYTSQRVNNSNINSSSKTQENNEPRKASDKIEHAKTNNSSNIKTEKKSYGPKVDPIIEEGNKALAEMGRLYQSINDDAVRVKINEIMRITDKIMQDAIEDPDDIPQIKKFFRYYLPTTIKLLNAYDRMDSEEFQGENITKSKNNIYEMLDVAIEAYKKRLDSLFENQALDIETEIDVMNQMLQREGLADNKDFILKEGNANG